MAVNDTDLERDPALARLLQAASGEQPPAALDAAILAEARREVGARPAVVAVVGGGGQASAPPLRAKRNWYVPVSIAAVMVLSVSLVLTMHHEKGDELSQPPVATASLPKAPAPAAEPPAAPAAKPDMALRDAVSATPRLAEEKRAEQATTAATAGKPEATVELAKKQRMEKAEVAADSVVALGGVRKDQIANAAPREQGPASDAAAKSAAGAVTGGLAAGAPAPQDRAPVEARREMEASGRSTQERQRATLGARGFDSVPVDGTSGVPAGAAAPQSAPSLPRETKQAPARPAPEPFPAQAPFSRDEGLARSEADRRSGATRGAISEAPAVAAAPVAPPAAMVAPQAKPAPPPAPKVAARPALKPAPVWRGLEDQPPEKWLERLAEFKRDNRPTDADELLAEFRRRFPDHPASAR